MKKMLITLLILSSLSFANTLGDVSQYKPSPTSRDEVSKIVNNPVNQNNVELSMFILKMIQDKNITDINKKIAFVDTFQLSDDIKDTIKITINQNINYSDFERAGYGIYLFKKCNHKVSDKVDSSSYWNQIWNINYQECEYQQNYSCDPQVSI